MGSAQARRITAVWRVRGRFTRRPFSMSVRLEPVEAPVVHLPHGSQACPELDEGLTTNGRAATEGMKRLRSLSIPWRLRSLDAWRIASGPFIP